RSKLLKILFLGLIFIFVMVLLASGSRKNAFALLVVVTVLLWYLLRGGLRWSIVLMVIGSLLVYDIVYDFVLNETALGTRLKAEALERGAEHRGELVKDGLMLFSQYPLLGIGLGSFTSYSKSQMMAHND